MATRKRIGVGASAKAKAMTPSKAITSIRPKGRVAGPKKMAKQAGLRKRGGMKFADQKVNARQVQDLRNPMAALQNRTYGSAPVKSTTTARFKKKPKRK